jgi:hypothetical protein
MKKAYQIEERRAIEKFRSHLMSDPGDLQMVLPLAEIAQMLRQGAAPFLLQAQLQLLTLIMNDEVDWLTGQRYSRAKGQDVRRAAWKRAWKKRSRCIACGCQWSSGKRYGART